MIEKGTDYVPTQEDIDNFIDEINNVPMGGLFPYWPWKEEPPFEVHLALYNRALEQAKNTRYTLMYIGIGVWVIAWIEFFKWMA